VGTNILEEHNASIFRAEGYTRPHGIITQKTIDKVFVITNSQHTDNSSWKLLMRKM
jgi:hypothetical protein